MERMKIRPEDALQFHMEPAPGKLEITATVPMTTQRDLSLAYSPGVAEACMEIHRNPADAALYTGKGNRVAVISNGTAVLGLFNGSQGVQGFSGLTDGNHGGVVFDNGIAVTKFTGILGLGRNAGQLLQQELTHQNDIKN